MGEDGIGEDGIGEDGMDHGGAAWSSVCGGLRELGDEILGPEYPSDPIGRTEGLRHLGLLADQALRWYLGADPDFPRFCQMNDTPEVADNCFAPVRGDAAYRITGNLATLFDVNISVHRGWGWLDGRGVSGDLKRDDLDVDADGNFTLLLGPDPQPGSWLALPPDAEYVQIREYFVDWTRDRPGRFEIVRLGSEHAAPPAPDPSTFAQAMDDALRWVRGYVVFHRRFIETSFPTEPNRLFAPERKLGSGGNSNIWYGLGRFDLDDDEALIVEFDQPAARVWTLQWLVKPWYENPDMANRLTGITSAHAQVDGDGRVRVVLAGSDPGVQNWLDTTGHRDGLMVLRWIWCDEGTDVATKVVPINELPKHLPDDTAYVDAAARSAQIAVRRSHLATRRR